MVNYRPQKFLGLLAPTECHQILSCFSCDSLASRDYLQTGMLLFPYPAQILERDH